MALKIFGRAATPGSPAARLLKEKQSTALILDEMQRCPVETFRALGSRHDAVAAVGDRGQEIYPMLPKRGEDALAMQKFVLQAGPTFAGESLLERAMAAPGAPDSPKVYHLTASKRFRRPVGRLPSSCTSRPLRCLDGIPCAREDDPSSPWLAQGALPQLVQLGILSGQRTQETPPRHSRVATIRGHLERWSFLAAGRVCLDPPASRGAET